jgi:transcriptional regulator with XRE-family HTH domain
MLYGNRYCLYGTRRAKTVNVSSAQMAGRLRDARKRAGLSQKSVASHLKMRRPSISEIERGRRGVKARELLGMAELYGVSSEFLADGIGAPDAQVVQLISQQLAGLTKQQLERLTRAIQIVKTHRV